MIPQITTVDLFKLASGDTFSLQIYKFVGAQPGPKAYIQANLHGAEIVGNSVIHQLIQELTVWDKSQLRGEIWLVPVCNPLGINQRAHFFSPGRFNSYDGKNWNRIFWEYQPGPDLEHFAKSQQGLQPAEICQNYRQKIKQAWAEEAQLLEQPQGLPLSYHYRYQLQSLCLDANYVIDIHSSSNQAINYVFGFRERVESIKYLLMQYAILMDRYDGDAFDEAFLKPWLALEKALNNLGYCTKFDVEAWTLELGSGMKMEPEAAAQGLLGIKNYLAHKQMLLAIAPVAQETTIVGKRQINSYYAPTGGMIQERLPLKTRVEVGTALYQLLSFNKQELPPEVTTIRSSTSGIVFDVSTNQCVSQGEYVMDILDC